MKHATLAILVVFSFITLWALDIHAARAGAQSDLKGMDEIYGTYAPDGDCRREPRIKIDATGLTYTYHGRTTHPAAFLHEASFFAPTANDPDGGDPDRAMFHPFPSGITQDKWGGLQAADWGPLDLVTDSKTHTIEITGAGQVRGKVPSGTTPLQAALVRSSPYATCGTHIAKAAPGNKGESVTYPLRINFGAEGQVKPTRAQDAAIHRALGRYVRPTGNPRQGPYTMTVADLNDDGRLDLFVTFNSFEYCGKDGCSGAIVMATTNGYSHHAILMPRFFGAIHILPGTHGGMHELRFNDGPGPAWQWNGKEYDVPGSKP